jgi:hypothetical protein
MVFFLLNNDGLFIHILGEGINTIQHGYYHHTSTISYIIIHKCVAKREVVKEV